MAKQGARGKTIEVSRRLFEDERLPELARRLGIGEAGILGLCIMAHTAGEQEPSAFELAMGWKGEPGRLVRELESVGLASQSGGRVRFNSKGLVRGAA